MNQHHGEIMATSPGEGKGSTFRVRLPIYPSEIPESTAAHDRSHGPAESAETAAASGVHAASEDSDRVRCRLFREELMMEKMRQGGLRVLFADDEAHLRDRCRWNCPDWATR